MRKRLNTHMLMCLEVYRIIMEGCVYLYLQMLYSWLMWQTNLITLCRVGNNVPLYKMLAPTKLAHYIIGITPSVVPSYEDSVESSLAALCLSAKSCSANVTCPNGASLTTADTCFRWVWRNLFINTLLCRRVILNLCSTSICYSPAMRTVARI